MYNAVMSYLYPSPKPFEALLKRHKEDPVAAFNASEVNPVMSKFMEEIEWNVFSLVDKSKEHDFFHAFKSRVTHLTFSPYHPNPDLLIRISNVIEMCPLVRSLSTKVGVYQPGDSTGYLMWRKSVYHPEAIAHLFKVVLKQQIVSERVSQAKIINLYLGSHVVAIDIFHTITTTQNSLREMEISVKNENQKEPLFNQAIRSLNRLRAFSLRSSQVKDEHVVRLVTNSPDLGLFKLFSASKLTDNGFKAIMSLRGLNTLHIESPNEVTIPCYQHLSLLPNLTHLSLVDLFSDFPDMKKPHFLEVVASHVTENLIHLNLGGCRIFGSIPKAFYFSKFKILQELCLDELVMNISPENRTIGKIAEAIPLLQRLRIRGWDLVSSHISQLSQFTALRKVSIAGLHVSPQLELLKQLKEEHPHLKDLEVEVIDDTLTPIGTSLK